MQNRRQFLSNLARGGIFGLMALFSGIMIKRWADADGCRRNFACGGCGLSDHCVLPEAGKFRKERTGAEKTKTEDGRDRKRS